MENTLIPPYVRFQVSIETEIFIFDSGGDHLIDPLYWEVSVKTADGKIHELKDWVVNDSWFYEDFTNFVSRFSIIDFLILTHVVNDDKVSFCAKFSHSMKVFNRNSYNVYFETFECDV